MPQAIDEALIEKRIFFATRHCAAVGRGGSRTMFLLAAVCVMTMVSAGAPAAGIAQGAKKSVRVNDSILGVHIGSSLEEVRDALKGRGTMGGRATRDGGRREAWTLKKTDFTSIAYQTNSKGQVKWVSGFLRPGKEIPFKKLGDLARASTNTPTEVIWNVETLDGGYRLVAKGPQGKARVVYLLSLATPPVE